VKERLRKVGLIPENERKALRDLSNTGISLGRRQQRDVTSRRSMR